MHTQQRSARQKTLFYRIVSVSELNNDLFYCLLMANNKYTQLCMCGNGNHIIMDIMECD